MTLRSPGTAPQSPSAPPRASILVVEDDPDHLELAILVLEHGGYEATGASNGNVALHRLEHGPVPDLILADLAMPVMDGWRFIAELKARPDLAAIPVVVFTGGGERALISAPVSAGYIEKSVGPERLLETIAACLARRKRRHASGSQPVGG
jgi:CheY-like chemotaxis protein